MITYPKHTPTHTHTHPREIISFMLLATLAPVMNYLLTLRDQWGMIDETVNKHRSTCEVMTPLNGLGL